MFRTLKNWMSGVVLFALIAVQVAPASALTISFTTEPAPPTPLRIVSSTIMPGQSNVGYTPTMQVNFNKTINSSTSGSALRVVSTGAFVDGNSPIGADYTAFTLNGALLPDTQYFLSIDANGTDGTSMDPTDPANAPYWDPAAAPNGRFRIYFRTAPAAGWSSYAINGGADTNTATVASNVPVLNAVIRVKASAALEGATVNDTNVMLHKGSVDGTMITATAILDASDTTNKTVLVTPSANLEYSTTYYLILTNVKDTFGNTL